MDVIQSRVMDELPPFMDFEASGLGPHGYPIQVAWSAPDGAVHECWFITPAGAHGWAVDEGWDPAAARVHGISLTTVYEHGRPAEWIAARLNAQLAGQTVYVDGGACDQVWCRQLFTAAAVTPQFVLGDYWELLLSRLPPSRTRRPGWQSALQDAAWRRVRMAHGGRRHHADTDVRYLVELYRLALGRAARHP